MDGEKDKLSSKEKVPGVSVSEESHTVTIFCDMKRHMSIDFLVDATVNCFLLSTPEAIFHLIYKMTLVFPADWSLSTRNN